MLFLLLTRHLYAASYLQVEISVYLVVCRNISVERMLLRRVLSFVKQDVRVRQIARERTYLLDVLLSLIPHRFEPVQVEVRVHEYKEVRD